MKPSMDSKSPVTVSVIIPTRNRSALLRRAVDSVLAQTFAALEVLIADDASSDDTTDVCQHLAERDARVSVIRSEVNVGAAAIRNKAIEQCRGQYVCFLDDDDEWFEAKLERQLKHIDHYSIVACRSRRVDGFVIAGLAEVSSLQSRASGASNDGGVSEVTLDDIFFNNGRLSPSCVMVKRQHLLDVGGFDESLPSSQGRDLFVRLVSRYGNAALMNEYLAKHFQRHGVPRITTSQKALVGGWMEYRKHAHLMSPRLQAWRRFVLCAREAELADSWVDRVSWIARSLAHVRPWRLGAHARILASRLLLR